MRLICKSTREELKPGQRVSTFRGEIGTLIGATPPHKPGSTGRIVFQQDGASFTGEYFPSVINAEWVD
jgi:hypothetical protein